MPSPGRLSLLGPPILQGPDGDRPLRGSKPEVLLCFLAAHPGRVFRRTYLAAFFWPDVDASQARRTLSTTLTRLRQQLPAWPLLTETETVGWDPAGPIDLDVTLLPQWTGPAATAQQLDAASQLWRGPFLAGFSLLECEEFEAWLQTHRQEQQRRQVLLLGRRAEAAIQQGRWAEVIACARGALLLDPYQERFTRDVMLATYQSGDRAAALALYDQYRQMLQMELHVEPDPATTALRDAIAAGAIQRGGAAAAASPGRPGASLATLARHEVSLVGRGDDLARLDEALQSGAHLLLLQGEAGIGKSRLVDEWLRRQNAAPQPLGTILQGHCYDGSQSLSYAPFVEALSGALQETDPATLPIPEHARAVLGRLLPEFGSLAGADQPERGDDLYYLRLYDAIGRLILALPAPRLLVLEDIHWLDEASLRLLAWLVRQPQLRQVPVIATAREGELSPAVIRFREHQVREGRLALVDLTGLAAPDVGRLVANMTGHADEDLTRQLHQETGGNPLFAIEVLRTIKAGELARPGAAGARELPLPRTVQAALHLRLSRLSREERSLVGAAAIFPEGAPLWLMALAAGLSQDEGVAALESLLKAMLLEERQRPATGLPISGEASRIAFPHEVIRRVVWNELSQTRRQLLHQQAFAVLRQAVPAETPLESGLPACTGTEAEQLAHHATQGGLWPAGFYWNRAAAAFAEQVFAYPVAVRLLEQALFCLGQMPEPRTHDQTADEIRLRLALLMHPHDFDAEQGLVEAAEAATGDLKTHELISRSRTLMGGGDLPQALSLLQKLLPVVRATRSNLLLVPYLFLAGTTLGLRGDRREAIRLLSEAVDQRESGPLQSYARFTRAGFAASVGQFTVAEEDLATLHGDPRVQQDPVLLGHVLSMEATVAYFRGEWQRSIRAARQGLETNWRAKNGRVRYLCHVWQGASLLHQGDALAAGEVLDQALALVLASKRRTGFVLERVHAWKAQVHLAAGELAQAWAEVRRGVEIATEHDARVGLALCRKMEAQLLAAEGRTPAALELLRGATASLQAMEIWPEVARCYALMATLAPAPGDRILHRRAALQLFQQLGMSDELARASD